ncbi:methyl-accepting chemotaxis protein [Azoarcus sp. KH32C]|uniref:methyl-accepting chemotaxis protein n=1 Tax=Azoarcus sp. KH32C TaxID=748247 RepID=UPI0002385FDA|nr:methyl-accepting chemotaxis protein [Azoarcus sp. KH32C]BAL24004.1 membrane-associated methyl-accepting chemotaxis protein [Azoarcus sp. KH32C]
MNTLLRPATWLSARLSFRWKLLATFLLFALPLAAVTALFVRDALQSIAHIERQRAALALQMPTLQLVRSVQDRYAAVLAAAHGDSSLQTLASRATKDFERIAPGVFADPAAADAGSAIMQKWRALGALPADDADAVRDAHEELLAQLFALREDIVDHGELSLNDEVLTQGLADLFNGQLVPLVRNLGQARNVGVGIVARKKISMSQREAMGLVRGSFDSLLTWMDGSTTKATRLDPALQPALVEPLQALNLATLGIQEYLTTKLINTTDFDIAPADFHAKGTLALDAGIEFAGKLLPALDRRMLEREERTRATFLWTLIGFALGTALVGYLFAGAYSSILRSVRELEQAAHAMADGDLRTRVAVRTRDEIGHVGRAFNTMAESFSRLIGQVIDAAGETQGAANELTRQVAQVTTASARQSDAAAQSSSAVQELAVSFQQVAAHAQDTNRIASRAAELSSEGRGIADRAATDMQQIVADIATTVQAVLSLEERSRNVDQVVRVIAEIAEQTNLLALNAAIEAARAGEVGRGFAVVADEVRKLADRTGNSTREIAGTIREMREQIHAVALGIRQGSDRVNTSSEIIGRITGALASIHDEVTRSATLVGEIVVATQAQTEAGNDIARSIENMSAMADENHGTAQKTSTAIEDLRELAGKLRGAVSGLNV